MDNIKYKKKSKAIGSTLSSIQKLLFRTQMLLIVTLALFLGVAGTVINIRSEKRKRDQNLQNIAEAIARSPILESDALTDYLDSLQDTLEDVDVISVVSADKTRLYHSDHDLIGTKYDGTVPEENFHTTDETGPSGRQRRAYALIYDDEGTCTGFVMAIMLRENIYNETYQTLLIFALITTFALLVELFVSSRLSGKIKKSLLGYEPDVFTAMYKVRDNILESLAEGILAADSEGKVQFMNRSAEKMLEGVDADIDAMLGKTVETGEKEFGANLGEADILIDRIPMRDGEEIIGAVGILHNRSEYRKLMEDLTGTRYLVDSMRANNHDFTNKLHVILGLIQMQMYEEASSYIQNITMVQREGISRIMNAVGEPSVAALLVGKTARAAELNIRFVLREGCHYSPADMKLPSEVLVTVIGNLLDNAFDAMNAKESADEPKELVFGIYSGKGAVLITVDDTGEGISEDALERIFENGYSTKGEGRGTGLYQVKTMVEELGGGITVESQEGIGTSVAVSFAEEKDV